MQNIKLNDTPEHNRLIWVLVFITLASLFFGCQADHLDPGISNFWWLFKMDQALANFWWLWLIPAGILWWQQRKMPIGIKRAVVAFFTLMCLIAFVFPYALMLGVWVILELIP